MLAISHLRPRGIVIHYDSAYYRKLIWNKLYLYNIAHCHPEIFYVFFLFFTYFCIVWFHFHFIVWFHFHLALFLKSLFVGAPGWLSRLSVRLQLRSWSPASWDEALHWVLCWQPRAWSLLQILCLPVSLPLLHSFSLSLSLSLSQNNK